MAAVPKALFAKAPGDERSPKGGQYYFIQFGHNDQKLGESRHTDPQTAYPQTLRRYIDDVRALGGVPILVRPLSRRNYTDGQLVNTALPIMRRRPDSSRQRSTFRLLTCTAYHTNC